MFRHGAFVTVVVLLFAPRVLGGEPSARTDLYGNELPEGAQARLGTVRLRQDFHQFRGLTFSPDGKRLAAGDFRGVSVWDAANGKEVARLKWPDDPPCDYTFAFGPDGKTIVGANDSFEMRVWDVETSKELSRCSLQIEDKTEFTPRGSAFSPDGKILAAQVRTDKVVAIRLYEVTSGKMLHALTDTTVGVRTTFAPDGRTLAARCQDDRIRLWDVASGKETGVLEGTAADGGVLAFAPDGKTLTVSCLTSITSLWDVASGKRWSLKDMASGKRWSLKGELPNSTTFAAAFTLDSKQLLLADHDTVRVVDVAKGEMIHELERKYVSREGYVGFSHDRWDRVVFSPDRKVIASTQGNSILLKDLASGKELVQTGGHRGAVKSLCYSPGGKHLVTAGADGTIRFWDPASGKETRCWKEEHHSASKLAFLPDGKKLVSRGSSREFNVLDEGMGKAVRSFEDRGWTFALSSGGGLLALRGENGKIEVWETASGKKHCSLTMPEEFALPFRCFYPLAFTPDGKQLLAALAVENPKAVGQDSSGPIVLWDLPTKKIIRTFRQDVREGFDAYSWELAFSPDGELVASTTIQGPLQLLNAANGEEVRQFGEAKQVIRRFTFSPDGKFVAATDTARVVHLWETATGAEVRTMKGHREWINTVAFAPDGRSLSTGSDDTTVLVWDVFGPLPQRKEPLGPKDLDALWTDLAADSSPKGFQALRTLLANPDEAVPFLQKQLKSLTRALPPEQLLLRQIADLDDDLYAVRAKASRELAELGRLAEPALRKALEGKPSPEARRRIETLLGQLTCVVLTPGQLRIRRAVAVLEYLGTPVAQAALEALAKGPVGDFVVEDAKKARDRLANLQERRKREAAE
jgi:WD40 repeat protein